MRGFLSIGVLLFIWAKALLPSIFILLSETRDWQCKQKDKTRGIIRQNANEGIELRTELLSFSVFIFILEVLASFYSKRTISPREQGFFEIANIKIHLLRRTKQVSEPSLWKIISHLSQKKLTIPALWHLMASIIYAHST